MVKNRAKPMQESTRVDRVLFERKNLVGFHIDVPG